MILFQDDDYRYFQFPISPKVWYLKKQGDIQLSFGVFKLINCAQVIGVLLFLKESNLSDKEKKEVTKENILLDLEYLSEISERYHATFDCKKVDKRDFKYVKKRIAELEKHGKL